MAAMEPEALIKRAQIAEQKRDAFRSLMQEVARYAMPERDSWSGYAPGQDRVSPTTFDSTAIVATGRFCNRLQQALFPAQQRWARASLPPELADDPAADSVQADLQRATDTVFRHIHASNFDQVVIEWAHDLAAGVGCMLVENGRLATRRSRAPLIRCQAIPAALVAFDEGPFGEVEGVFFSQRLPARLVARTYPDARGLPDDIARAATEDPDREVELLQATIYDAEDDTWHFQVLHRATRKRFVERRYRTSPWIITRWIKAPGEQYGRGPLTQALPDIRTLNKLRELLLKSMSIAIGGAWTVLDDGVLNPDTVRIAPGAMIPVRSNGGTMGPSMRGLDFPGRPDLAEALQAELKTAIRQVLFDDPLPPEVQAGLTATEVVERVRRFQADTGAFGRLQQDAVTPLFVRCVDILEQEGQFPPEIYGGLLDQLRNQAIRVVPTSPLAQAQDRADVQAVMMYVQGLAQLGDAGAAMLKAGIKLPEAARYVAARSGVPHQLIPSTEDQQQAEAAAAQAQRDAQLLSSPAIAQVAGQLAKAATTPEGTPQA